MLGAKLGVQYVVYPFENTARASADVRHTARNTASSLEKWLHNGALITLVAVVAVAVVATYMPAAQPSHLIEPDTLFTASATIMGLAAFGSALATLGTNRGLIKSIAYALLPVITIQAVFMASLVSNINFPAMSWIGMTAVWLFLLVLAVVANRVLPDGTGGTTNPAR